MIPMALSMPNTQTTDLAGRAATMDEAAFRHLYDRTARPLRAYLMRSCGDLVLTDDLLQNVFDADQAGCPAELVDHDRDVDPRGLHLPQQRVHGGRLVTGIRGCDRIQFAEEIHGLQVLPAAMHVRQPLAGLA